MAALRDAACSCDGQLPRTAASDFQRSGDDLLAGQLRQPRRHAQRELRARVDGTVLHGHRQLHRGRCEDGGARLHGLDILRPAASRAVPVLSSELRVPRLGPRRQREDLPRRDGQLQRRGHHRHHREAAGDRAVPRQAPLQLLRRRRAAGPRLALHAAQRPGRREHAGAGVHRFWLRDARRAGNAVQVGLLQGSNFQEGEKPAGTGIQHGADDRRLQCRDGHIPQARANGSC